MINISKLDLENELKKSFINVKPLKESSLEDLDDGVISVITAREFSGVPYQVVTFTRDDVNYTRFLLVANKHLFLF